MMREMKDHELELVVGGWSVGEPGGDADIATHSDGIKFTDKYLNGVAQAAPFLMEQLQLPQTTQTGQPPQHNFTQPPRNLPGAQKRQTSKGGPFTFKTPYLNR